jgi:hypothetical protein
MWKNQTRLLLLLAVGATTSCEVTRVSGVIDTRCLTDRVIYFSRDDTPGTIRAITEHNEGLLAVCPGLAKVR